MIIYGSLQAEFLGTKHNGHIHRYGTPIENIHTSHLYFNKHTCVDAQNQEACLYVAFQLIWYLWTEPLTAFVLMRIADRFIVGDGFLSPN